MRKASLRPLIWKVRVSTQEKGPWTASDCEVQERKPQVRSSSIMLDPCGGTNLSRQAADSTPCSSCSGHWPILFPQKPVPHHCYFINPSVAISVTFFSTLSCFSFHVFVPLTRVQTTHFSNIILWHLPLLGLSGISITRLDLNWKRTSACNMEEHICGIPLNLSGEKILREGRTGPN